MWVIFMNKKNADYLVKILGFQCIVCIILFCVLYGFKKSQNTIFFEIKQMFSDELSENMTPEDFKDIYASVVPEQTQENKEAEEVKEEKNEKNEKITQTDLSESALVVNVLPSQKGEDIISATPSNVSLKKYKLSESMVVPVNGKTTSEFGYRYHPIDGDLRFHAGMDIAAEAGENIYAAFDGEVVEASYDQWNGNFMKIKHNDNILTVYCHCESLNVKKGDVIRAGEIIGSVGSTGRSTGPHLHFELRIKNISYNPQYALNEAKYAI